MLKQPVRAVENSADVRAAALLVLRRRHAFENHVVVYLVVNLTIWLGVGLIWHTWYPWSLLPACAWGVALAFHAWFTFGPPNQPITEEAVDREVARLSGRRPALSVQLPEPHETYWRGASEPAESEQRDVKSEASTHDESRTPTASR
jgi:hypothetical protein